MGNSKSKGGLRLKVGEKYRFVGDKQELVYMGKSGHWNEFAKVDEPTVVWAEVLDRELHLIESIAND